MSDAEDTTFEAADAGSSDTVPVRAGELKKGGFVVIKGHPCKVVDISTSKTGKHGHAKANITALDIFTNKKYEDVAPTSHNLAAPVVKRSEMQLMDIDDNDVNEDGSIASIMNPETGETVDDLRVPTNDPEYAPMIEALKADNKDILVTVLEAMGIRKIQAQFVQKDRT